MTLRIHRLVPAVSCGRKPSQKSWATSGWKKSTARPIAQSKQLEIEFYDPSRLGGFSQLLLDTQQDALVIGHSNTTGVLAGLLADVSEEAFDEAIYDRLYQVIISGKQARLNLLHQSFYCEP